MCECVCVHTHKGGPEESEYLELEVPTYHELSDTGARNGILVLQEQCVLLTTEPSFPLSVLLFLTHIFTGIHADFFPVL